ncbi:hypothetical protein HHL19_35845 [Streptomyces sp. R302]|uniref:hypothetical protein n=1 Tax=unclassified Streptomyces TaxID=2593676 RepID=UPI00145EF7E3|nr:MULTISPECIES: hypothetical protein [unclassified Streptomyces]NML55086.1 hypothetical protein [Streptomyces sp. R301]NML83884.1 hypothetical protein [Streptomyces sp. R302]
MSAVSPAPAEKFKRVRELVDAAEAHAENGAAHRAMESLVDAAVVIHHLLDPNPGQTWASRSLEGAVRLVEGAKYRRTPEQIAGAPIVQDAIGQHAPEIRALGETAALAERRYRAALIEWITRDWTCRCLVSCADDPATACSLSGREHVHPEIPSLPGVFGPCPQHPDAPGDK